MKKIAKERERKKKNEICPPRREKRVYKAAGVKLQILKPLRLQGGKCKI
jgi:hypothetical protein